MAEPRSARRIFSCTHRPLRVRTVPRGQGCARTPGARTTGGRALIPSHLPAALRTVPRGQGSGATVSTGGFVLTS